jgi:pimeloyl-ACP methyl ester carboxylesterase
MFRAAGYRVWNLFYPSTQQPIEELANLHIAPRLEAAGESRVHIVTHSLGGVLAHYCLQDHRPPRLGRVVMTSPGLHGSEALEVYRHNPLFRLVYGPASCQSGTGGDAFTQFLPKAAGYELGVIAGAGSLDPIANLFIPWPHDGKISAARTRLAGMADHIVLPLPHDMTCNHPLALFQIWSFIQGGHFFHIGMDAALAA